MPEKGEREPRVLGPNDARELVKIVDSGAKTAGAEFAQFAVIARVLPKPGLAVPAMVIGVDRVTGRNKRLSEILVPGCVLPQPMRELQNRFRFCRGPHVKVHSHPVSIDELSVSS